MKFTTKLLHTPYPKKDAYGALRFPTYNNAAFGFETSEDLEGAFKGTKPEHIYSRSTNPTVQYFEQTIVNITGGLHAIAVASGLSAITNTILGVAKVGDEIVSSNKLFGNSYSLFESTFRDMGILVKFVDFQNSNAIKNAITDKTRALFCESITNPQIEVINIPEVSKIAKEYKLPLIVDTTATPPYIFNAKKQGVDIEVLSGTKFISGGGTAIGGVIIDNGTYNWQNSVKLKNDAKKFGPFTFVSKLRKELYRNIGGCMSAQTATQLSLGLETLELRIDRACSNAQKVAEFLEKHQSVAKVAYPGLQSSPYYNISKELFLYPGSIIGFELNSQKECFTFMDALKIVKRATNLQDNKSLIIHPASTIYVEYSKEKQIELDVKDTLIRFSIGIENIEDIIEDLEQALAKL